MAFYRRQLLGLGLASIALPVHALMPVPSGVAEPEREIFDKLVARISGKASAENNMASRQSIYEDELGAADRRFSDNRGGNVEVLAFERDFAPDGTEDNGYVLLTSGMSDRRMNMPTAASSVDGKARAELIWYVREPTDEIVRTMQWLAAFPFIDDIWLGFGHRVPMPTPPLQGCTFRTFLFLTPIIRPHKRIAETLSVNGEPVEILTVNLISDTEYAMIKSEGLDDFLDLLDERGYPSVFDPKRKSYV